MSYSSRDEAGRRLAKALRPFRGENTVVLALPRGGVVLGAIVAKELQSQLGVVLVRKIGHPSYAEFAIGAIAEGGLSVYDEREISAIDNDWLRGAEAAAEELIRQRHEMYFRKDIVPPDIKGKTVILVDDGIATGLSMRAAILAIENKHPKQIVTAVPVASQEGIDSLLGLVEQVIVLDDPTGFGNAIGPNYREFEQIDDKKVRSLLFSSVKA